MELTPRDPLRPNDDSRDTAPPGFQTEQTGTSSEPPTRKKLGWKAWLGIGFVAFMIIGSLIDEPEHDKGSTASAAAATTKQQPAATRRLRRPRPPPRPRSPRRRPPTRRSRTR